MRIVLLHGKGGSPEGSVKVLKSALEPYLPVGTLYQLPLCPHSDNTLHSDLAYSQFVDKVLPPIPLYSIVIGVSLGGLFALRAQEDLRPDLNVIAISSPSHAENIYLSNNVVGSRIRTLFYSDSDDVIKGRTEYPEGMDVYMLPWLTHNTSLHAHTLSLLIQDRINHTLSQNTADEVNLISGAES